MDKDELGECQIRDGVIVPLSKGRPVHPLLVLEAAKDLPRPADPDLPSAFAKLADGDESAICDFFVRYGLLGFMHYVDVQEAERRGVYDPKKPGEPVRWVLTHSKNVEMILRLVAELDHPTELKKIICSMTVSESGVASVEWRAPRRGTCAVSTVSEHVGDCRSTAVTIAANALRQNLGGTQRSVSTQKTDDGWRLKTEFIPRTLLDWIYWLLADAVTAQRVRICANARCKRPFIVTHERETYCPPAWGMKGVSPCMNRDKVRRARKKRSALGLGRKGIRAKVIARRLGEDLATVRGWLRRRSFRGRRPG